ncbi:MAG: NAD(P)-dependent oxidoreductase [Hyphomicrobiaceae bacterium]|nr:NAD(P)-dependent oxidoreductase [Hyphomicrobiaceae bacterium]
MTFKVGVTRDLLRADGTPAFDSRAFAELDANPAIVWEWLPEDVREITPEIAAAYDALHVNLPLVTAASVARQDCRLKVVARNGVGYDSCDIPALTAKGILLTNTPVAVRRPVAVAALTMIFALAGRLLKKNEIVRQGRWNDRTLYMSQGLTGRTLGVIGAGSIGKELLALARPFFRSMIAADPYVDAATLTPLGAALLPLDDVLRHADYVVVACLLTPETHHLLDETRLRLMKPSAYLVNMARGPIVDEAALARVLAAGGFLGAGLDVTEREPIETDSPLLAMDNVIITPHALCWTDECFYDIAATALRSIADVSLARRPAHVVNADAYDVPPQRLR